MEQAAFVLHSRPYRETSAIIELLTEQQSRISAVVRGSRSNKSPSTLQPFQKLLVQFSGKSELKNLTSSEVTTPNLGLRGNNLYAGFYVNEISMRLIPKELYQPELFQLYSECICELSQGSEQTMQASLRRYELLVLQELGFGIDFSIVTEETQQSSSKFNYTFYPQHGFEKSHQPPNTQTFAAAELIKIANMNFTDHDTLSAAKRLMRLALQPYLGNKPLKSRELFVRNST